MPYTEVMHKFGRGMLHSGSKKGPRVKSRKQAVAIMLSEKREGAHSGPLKGLKKAVGHDYRGKKVVNGRTIYT
jgi:hypothetical protein